MIKKNTKLFLLKLFTFIYIFSLNFHQLSLIKLDDKIYFKISDFIFIFLIIIFFINIENLKNLKITKFDILVLIFPSITIIQLFFFKDVVSFIGVLTSIYLFMIYFIFKTLLSNDYFNRIINYIIISGLIASLLGIIGWLLVQFNYITPLVVVYDYPFKIGNAGRVTALFETPNSLLLFLILPLFLTFYKLIKKFKIKNLVIFFLILFCLILTFSKSLLIIFGLFLFYFFHKKKHKYFSIISLFFISIFYLFITNILILNKSSNFYEILLNKKYTGGKEEIVYDYKGYVFVKTNYFLAKKKNLELSKESFIIGSGFNSYINYKNLEYPSLIGRPHSTYFGFLSEYGLIGLFFVFMLFLSLYKKMFDNDNFSIYLNLISLFLIIDAFNTDLLFTKIFWIFFSIVHYNKLNFPYKKI